MKFFLSTILICVFQILNAHEKKPYVTAELYGQLGNTMFQVATASALAWDHEAIALFPNLITQQNNNLPVSFRHVFFRCCTDKPKQSPEYYWNEPTYDYQQIPYHPNMHINGYFQSEKYFAHHRKRLLELFAPSARDLEYIEEKYGHLLAQKPIGIQLRWYFEDPTGSKHVQYGLDYLTKAVQFFPADSLFLVSSNNLDFARQQMPKHLKNVVYIENEPNYIDLFLLSKCENNIITNSSFGWWAAWLNKNPNKVVIAPENWFNPNFGMPFNDVIPASWIKIKPEQDLPKEKPIVVVVTSYNNMKWYQENLKSIFAQKYSNYQVIYVDDCSTDGTGKAVEEFIHQNDNKGRFIIIHNEERVGALANIYSSVNLCSNRAIIVSLDGDDWFAHDKVLQKINTVYSSKEIWLTYGNWCSYPDGYESKMNPFSQKIIEESLFRLYRAPSHLKTFYAWLFKLIDVKDLLFDDKFFPVAWDIAMMFPMLEMASERHAFIPEILYIYNEANPLSDFRNQKSLVRYLDKLIRNKPPYQRLKEAPIK